MARGLGAPRSWSRSGTSLTLVPRLALAPDFYCSQGPRLALAHDFYCSQGPRLALAPEWKNYKMSWTAQEPL